MDTIGSSDWQRKRARLGPAFCVGLVASLGASLCHAQFQPDYWEVRAEAERARAEQARVLDRERHEAILAERSARAHARMREEGGFSAGLTGAVDWPAAHPNVFDSGFGSYRNHTYVPPPQRYTFWSSPGLDFPIWQDVAPEGEPIESLYSEYISGPIVQARCVACHVVGGVSDAPNSRLQFSPSTVENYVELNRAVFENLVAVLEEDEEIEDPVAYILNKVSGGITHQGGIPVATGTANYANLERFLRQVDEESGSATPGLTSETLFEGVTMASSARTLRRAAILFAGRLPTQVELDAVADGEESSLRQAIRGLMTGQGFHDFLIRASNDRLLTDRQLGGKVVPLDSNEFYALNQKFAAMLRGTVSRGFEDFAADVIFQTWVDALNTALARAPLELIAYVVENDLPYTEILTADYIMANPMAAEAYGDATTKFENVKDPFEFKPSSYASYYRKHDSQVVVKDESFAPGLVVDVVVEPGILSTDYPHAGILNTTAFLKRYPSTATNRNRARSRWTYYHFLGQDIEKSNPRPTDPDALVDMNNPTRNNPHCIVCHKNLDPVAGAFQNYGDEGMYRDQWGGKDSLPELYKEPPDGSQSGYVDGDTWYRDMRAPGFGDSVAPNPDDSVQWLARQIVADYRFAEAAVKFWWQPIMGVDILDARTDSSDPDYQGRSVAAQAQAAEVSRLSASFRAGIEGGSPYNGKDLLTEIALSPWFRAESVTEADRVRYAAIRDAGVSRLLTPEELNKKTDAITGYMWGRGFRQTTDPEQSELHSHFDGGQNLYKLLYGGIDSDGVITRAADMTPVMAAVAQSHAAEVSCPIVRREFFFWDADDRRLFKGITKFDTPVSEKYSTFDVSADTWETRQTYSLDVPLTAGSKTLRIVFENDYEHEGDDRNLNVDRVTVRDSTGATVENIELEGFGSAHCRSPESQFEFHSFWCNADLSVPLEVFRDDTYVIDIVAHQDRAGDEDARMRVTVESDGGVTVGSTVIRNQLVDLHRMLYGVDVAPDSADVNEAFKVFLEAWARKRQTEGNDFTNSYFVCHENDVAYYDGLVENVLQFTERGDSELDWPKVEELYRQTDMSDPAYAVRAWAITLAFLLTDYRYLYH